MSLSTLLSGNKDTRIYGFILISGADKILISAGGDFIKITG